MVSRNEMVRVRPLHEQLGLTRDVFEDETRQIRQWNAFKGEPLLTGAFDHMSATAYRKLRRSAERGLREQADQFTAWFAAQRSAALARFATA